MTDAERIRELKDKVERLRGTVSTIDRDRVEAAWKALRKRFAQTHVFELISRDDVRLALAAADAVAPPPSPPDREAVAEAAWRAFWQGQGPTEGPVGRLSDAVPSVHKEWLRIADAVIALLPTAPPPVPEDVRQALEEYDRENTRDGGDWQTFEDTREALFQSMSLWVRTLLSTPALPADTAPPPVPDDVRRHLNDALVALDRGHLNTVAGAIGRALALLATSPPDTVRDARASFELNRHRIVALLTDLKVAFDAVAVTPAPPADTGDATGRFVQEVMPALAGVLCDGDLDLPDDEADAAPPADTGARGNELIEEIRDFLCGFENIQKAQVNAGSYTQQDKARSAWLSLQGRLERWLRKNGEVLINALSTPTDTGDGGAAREARLESTLAKHRDLEEALTKHVRELEEALSAERGGAETLDNEGQPDQPAPEETLDKEVARLQKEHLAGALADATRKYIAKLQQQAFGMQDRIRELEEALRPFAKAADNYDRSEGGYPLPEGQRILPNNKDGTSVMIGDFRRARARLGGKT